MRSRGDGGVEGVDYDFVAVDFARATSATVTKDLQNRGRAFQSRNGITQLEKKSAMVVLERCKTQNQFNIIIFNCSKG